MELIKILSKYKNKNIKEVLLSVYNSIKYKSCEFYKLPIVTNGICKIKKDKSGKLIIKKRLRLNGEISALCKNKSSIDIRRDAKLTIDGVVDLGAGTNIVVNEIATISIGNNTYIAGDSKIYANKSINIGNDCALSWGLTIIDSDFHSIIYNTVKNNVVCEPINIGNHVWVGCNVTILKGVNIGDNSIIAAGSIVNKDVPKNCLVAGNPARIIKQDISWN